MREIKTRAELVQLAKDLGVRPDWHEPDEQDVTAEIYGNAYNFDNAMGPGEFYGQHNERAELHVVLRHYNDTMDGPGEKIAVVNLATLFAWATGYEGDTRGHPNPNDRKEIARDIREFGHRIASAAQDSQYSSAVGMIVQNIVERVSEEIAQRVEQGKDKP